MKRVSFTATAVVSHCCIREEIVVGDDNDKGVTKTYTLRLSARSIIGVLGKELSWLSSVWYFVSTLSAQI